MMAEDGTLPAACRCVAAATILRHCNEGEQMGFEQLAKLRDELAKKANAERKQKQADKPADKQAERHADEKQAAPAGARNAKPKDTKSRDARDAKPAHKHTRPAGKPEGKRADGGKGAQARPAAKQNPNPVDPVVHTIGKLQKRFPLAFPKNPAPKLALKIGILEDLLAQAGELKLTEQEVRDAVSTWCRGSRYWASLTEGAPRVDLNGAQTGTVTAADSAFARRRAGGRTKPAVKGSEAAAGVDAADAVADDVATAAEAPAVPATDETGDTPAADQAQG
jgi:ProP effector